MAQIQKESKGMRFGGRAAEPPRRARGVGQPRAGPVEVAAHGKGQIEPPPAQLPDEARESPQRGHTEPARRMFRLGVRQDFVHVRVSLQHGTAVSGHEHRDMGRREGPAQCAHHWGRAQHISDIVVPDHEDAPHPIGRERRNSGGRPPVQHLIEDEFQRLNLPAQAGRSLIRLVHIAFILSSKDSYTSPFLVQLLSGRHLFTPRVALLHPHLITTVTQAWSTFSGGKTTLPHGADSMIAEEE